MESRADGKLCMESCIAFATCSQIPCRGGGRSVLGKHCPQECDDEEECAQHDEEDACLAMHAMEVEDGRSADGTPRGGHALLSSSPTYKP